MRTVNYSSIDMNKWARALGKKNEEESWRKMKKDMAHEFEIRLKLTNANMLSYMWINHTRTHKLAPRQGKLYFGHKGRG